MVMVGTFEIPLPILIIHSGDSFYLSEAIAQAQQSNPASPIYLLGDKANAYYRGVKYVPYADYFAEAERFGPIYKAWNSNPDAAEWIRFCFQRWLVAEAFVLQNGIKSCIIIDTDALVYADLGQLQKLYTGCDITISQPDEKPGCVAGHASIVYNVGVLAKLREIMFEMYEDTSLAKAIEDRFNNSKLSMDERGTTEMHALGILYERYPDLVYNTSPNFQELAPDKLCIDHTMMAAIGWEMEARMIKIYWRDNMPYGKWLETGQLIPFAVIHFQGKAKWKMRASLRLSNKKVIKTWRHNRRQYRKRKLKRKFKALLHRKC